MLRGKADFKKDKDKPEAAKLLKIVTVSSKENMIWKINQNNQELGHV